MIVLATGCARVPSPLDAAPLEPASAVVKLEAHHPGKSAAEGPDEGDADGDLDGDSIFDSEDQCPGIAEDSDGFRDGDGCPDRDNDGDGVLDAAVYVDGEWINCDRARERRTVGSYPGAPVDYGPWIDCRDDPEIYNGEDDGDGCPENVLEFTCYQMTLRPDRLPLVLHEGRLELSLAAQGELPGVVKTLVRAWAFELHVDVHSNARGPKIRQQTKALARSIADEMVALDPKLLRVRLHSRGFGGDKPIADRRTAEGRSANRRVELSLIYPQHDHKVHMRGVCELGTPAQRSACGCAAAAEETSELP